MSNLVKLGAALDKENFEWLQNQNEDIANAVAEEVRSGVAPNAIGRYMLKAIGEDRRAFISRVVSAARHIASQK
jgi:hypothetical protein